MTASIKAGLNNDMHLMTDGVTRAYIDSAGDVTINNHLKVGKENIIQPYSAYGYVADFQAPSGNQTYISIGTPQDATLGNTGLVMGVDPSAYRITGRENKYMRLATNDLDRVVIDPSGYVTKPYQPAFLATNSTDVNFSNGSEWSANTAVYNTGNHYSTSTYKFTAPVSGYYIFGGMARFDGSGAASITYMHVYRKVNGVANHPSGILPGLSTVVYSGSGFSAFTWNDMVYLTANDSFNYDLYGGSTSTTILHNQSYWYGYLLG